jgi:hypothetical protein
VKWNKLIKLGRFRQNVTQKCYIKTWHKNLT